MKRVEIFANQELLTEFLAELHEHLPDQHYTILDVLQGKGKKGEARGDGVWPERNFYCVMFIKDEEDIRSLQKILIVLKNDFPVNALKAVISSANIVPIQDYRQEETGEQRETVEPDEPVERREHGREEPDERREHRREERHENSHEERREHGREERPEEPVERREHGREERHENSREERREHGREERPEERHEERREHGHEERPEEQDLRREPEEQATEWQNTGQNTDDKPEDKYRDKYREENPF